MNDTPSLLSPHAAPPLDPVVAFPPAPPFSPGGLASSANVPEEDEPYTIKCICGFQDDDGNTVFCEGCETWQHIECYYPTKKVPDVHNCVDCEPRVLDTRRATERQKRRREQIDSGDRKPKRPHTKTNRKKAREQSQGASTVNGWSNHDRLDGAQNDSRRSASPREHLPPAKKAKTSHRPSLSGSSHPSSAALLQSRKRTGSSTHLGRSPSKSPAAVPPTNGLGNELYSQEFMRLHREDPGDVAMEANLFANIGVTGSLSSWIKDPSALAQVTKGKTPQDVFQRIDRPIESLPLPDLTKRLKRDTSLSCHGTYPIWQYLTVESFVPAGAVVGELKGQIGHLQDYYHDPANRWHTLRHPEPFVFFHPQLPIHIDCRKEGSRCRYVRRSCQPNLVMKTLISNGVEYHFCLFAKEDMQPGAEITIGWDLDEEVHGCINRVLRPSINGGVKQEGFTDEDDDYIANWVSPLLANFGGCACSGPRPCAFARFDRRGMPASPETGILKGRRGKKGKASGTPQGVNSRASSENVPEDDADDNRSASGSVPSKSRSRDMTPSSHLLEPSSGPGPELSDREKRKIAALERSFEQLEQEAQQNALRRKKRNSGGSNLNTPAISSSKQLGHRQASPSQPTTSSGAQKSRSTDRNLFFNQSETRNRRQSNAAVAEQSPRADNTQSLLWPRPVYVDIAIQTDPESDVWYDVPQPPPKPKVYVSLARRLLTRCHADRVRLGEGSSSPNSTNRSVAESPQPPEMVPYSPMPDSNLKDSSRSPQVVAEDIEMKDSESEALGDTKSSSPMSIVKQEQPEKLPGPNEHRDSTAPKSDVSAATDIGFSDSRVPVNGHGVNTSPTSPSLSETLSLTTSTTTHSPLGPGPGLLSATLSPTVAASVQPSPVKKKLSLSDYVSRRSKAEAPSADKTVSQGQSLLPDEGPKPLAPVQEEPQQLAVEETSGKASSPVPAITKGEEKGSDLTQSPSGV
ncbi:hypothetical protein L228DRAFT_265886 [Xylona heveae TC161]|uniref:SET domain-containing protein n=1 Tax=Xylona heveae (strain CBS 132557 / TC161) TaxID=1328760 RepID=A0A161TGU3_XYLHT|nr:hypothetical protein L228DRAFT_265886 [Xylona heveae TC161]KZF25417.1 hypothetical protein L228DRAFT_265886 [Xylona heveae TC161]